MRGKILVRWIVASVVLTALLGGAVTAQGFRPPEPSPPDILWPFAEEGQAEGMASLQTWNVGRIGRATLPTRAVAVQGIYAYVGVGPYLVVLNVSDPTNLREVGRTDAMPDIVQDVAVAGNYAYVADGRGGLRVIDISNPSAPREVGFYPDCNAVYVAVQGEFAYLAGGGLFIVNISDPEQPELVSQVEMPDYAYVNKVVVVGNLAYCVAYSYQFDIFGIVDATDPYSPTLVSSRRIGTLIYDIAIAGDYAYLATWGFGLYVFYIADPSNPVEVGYYYHLFGWATGVAVQGDYAYVVSGLRTLRVINIADPYQPVLVGTYDISGEILRVVAAGQQLYIASGNEGLQVFSGAGSDTLIRAGSYRPVLEFLGVAARGFYAYITEGYSGLYKYPLTTPPALA